ncbi:NAD(P)/FAD-dependent oxidoreductase [Streptomyces carpaticus]|uniref:phytoene desaturase family protein n=1 Tax=Streptomyces TaxID=1883 RepID=UPI0022030A34|nr:NAD(P)/FAD-dependent oxidoreductase [Streptomyces carpaticus]
MPTMRDAVVVGAGPNGLTAAVELARRGLSVEVFEAKETVGGGARTEELTLPGFRHDPCSAVHPMGAGSPAFKRMPLERYGLEWLHAELALAHPFPDGSAAVLAREVGVTAASFGPRDAEAYRRLMAPYLGRWDTLAGDFLKVPWDGLPRGPLTLARFGLTGMQPAAWVARARFRDEKARALFHGLAAHVISPAGTTPATAAIALVFALAAHEGGWPIARGGSQGIVDALAGYLTALGGTVHTGVEVRRLDELPPARAYVFDTSPTAMARIAGLGRAYPRFRYGAASFKIDYALDGPVPWTAQEAHRAGTVHLGATGAEIETALRAATVEGRAPEVPFLITSQPTQLDPSRAPAGKHVFWAYGHVPNGWDGDLTEALERQIERFAPGFRDLVLARAVAGPAELARRNANYVGGDTACGAFSGLQTMFRPRPAWSPYTTAHPAVFLCSQAAWPGPGVHGMSGHNAAKVVWRRLRQQRLR